MNCNLSKPGHRLVRKTMRNGAPVCIVVLTCELGQVTLTRVDFGEWEMNRSNGTVEMYETLDNENTLKLAESLGAETSSQLLTKVKAAIKDKFGIGIFYAAAGSTPSFN